MNGIDVSTLQGVIDWQTAGKGIDFAMNKATQGRGEGAVRVAHLEESAKRSQVRLDVIEKRGLG